MSDQTMKVLLDTDIGSDIDDAVALAYLLCQPRCELLGITTVTGEAVKRAEIASAICTNLGRDDVPIHPGCDRPLLIESRQPTAPQAEALGDRPRRKDFEANSAIEFIRDTVRKNPGEVTLLAIGPLTNVAIAFATDPELPCLLKQMVLMCGRFFNAMGKEWNAIGDPHATAIVYGGGRQSRPPRHISFGLDVTLQCTMSADDVRQRFTAKPLQPVLEQAEVWFRQRQQVTFHDPLAAACIFQPELCQYRQGKVAVSVVEPTAGWTIFTDQAEEKSHTVAAAVDAKAFGKHYFATVK